MIDTYAMTRAERLRTLTQMMRGLLKDYPLKMLLMCGVARGVISMNMPPAAEPPDHPEDVEFNKRWRAANG